MRAAPALFSLALLLSATAADAKVMAVPRHEPVACTMEAKLCPDGSSVSRQGPNCEFAPCPGDSANGKPPRQHVAPMPVNPEKKPVTTTPDEGKDTPPEGSEGGDEGTSGGDPDEGGVDDSTGE